MNKNSEHSLTSIDCLLHYISTYVGAISQQCHQAVYRCTVIELSESGFMPLGGMQPPFIDPSLPIFCCQPQVFLHILLCHTIVIRGVALLLPEVSVWELVIR